MNSLQIVTPWNEIIDYHLPCRKASSVKRFLRELTGIPDTCFEIVLGSSGKGDGLDWHQAAKLRTLSGSTVLNVRAVHLTLVTDPGPLWLSALWKAHVAIRRPAHETQRCDVNVFCLRGSKPCRGLFSNWYVCKEPFEFVVPGFVRRNGFPTTLACDSSEKAIMAAKAIVFDDPQSFDDIMQSCGEPSVCYKVGNGVEGTKEDAAFWNNRLLEITTAALFSKFDADAKLSARLTSSGSSVLVAADADDIILGVGLGTDADDVKDPSLWRGRNVFGLALMEVRDMLKDADQEMDPEWIGNFAKKRSGDRENLNKLQDALEIRSPTWLLDALGESASRRMSDEVIDMLLRRKHLLISSRGDDSDGFTAAWALHRISVTIASGDRFDEVFWWLLDNLGHEDTQELRAQLPAWIEYCWDEEEEIDEEHSGEIREHLSRRPLLAAAAVVASHAHRLWGGLEDWQQDFLLDDIVTKGRQSCYCLAVEVKSLVSGESLPRVAAEMLIREGREVEHVPELIKSVPRDQLNRLHYVPGVLPLKAERSEFHKFRGTYLQLCVLLLSRKMQDDAEDLMRIFISGRVFGEEVMRSVIAHTSDLRCLTWFVVSYLTGCRTACPGNKSLDFTSQLLLERAVRDAAKEQRQSKKRSDTDVNNAVEAALLLDEGGRLCTWASEDLRSERRREAVDSLLGSWGHTHFLNLLERAFYSSGGLQCDERKVRAILNGSARWTYLPRNSVCFERRRKDSELVRLFAMYVKLSFSLDGDGVQLEDFICALCSGNQFHRIEALLPEDGELRRALSDSVKGSLRSTAEVSRLHKSIGFAGFFHSSFRKLLKNDKLVKLMALRENKTTLFMAAVAKLLSFDLGKEVDLEGVVFSIFEQAKVGGESFIGLFLMVLQEVVQRPFADFVAGESDTESCNFTLGKLVLSGSVLQEVGNELKNGVSQSLEKNMTSIVATFLHASPSAWLPLMKSLDTILFFLKYLDKEDLGLAYERFEASIKGSGGSSMGTDCMLDYLDIARRFYVQPLIGLEEGEVGRLAKSVDVKQLIMQNAGGRSVRKSDSDPLRFSRSDWELLLRVAAAAVEGMKENFGMLMLPHHTQMITLIMFAALMCNYEAGGVGRSEPIAPKSMFAQVGTGEGKSWIIGMLAAFTALKGLRAHVVINDDALRERDFSTMSLLFAKLEIRASCTSDALDEDDVDIVYTGMASLELMHKQILTAGKLESDAVGLQDTVLIFDEIDELIIDKGVNTCYVASEPEVENYVDTWLSRATREKGRVESVSPPANATDSIIAAQQRFERAYKDMLEKVEGMDYVVEGNEIYSLDPKSKAVQRNSYSLWLEFKRKQHSSNYVVRYRTTQCVLCRQRCFTSYRHTFGLSGSLGRETEKKYLESAYDAVHCRVPSFLDTCRGVPGKRTPTLVAAESMLQPDAQSQLETVARLAAQRCVDVPVLVIVDNPRSVKHFANGVVAALEAQGDSVEEGRVLEMVGDDLSRLAHLATKPMPPQEMRASSKAAPKAWRVAVTTAPGGRGYDYRISDRHVDQNGGMLVIITWVPWSEREWTQFKGRTARQDHPGQYAVILNGQDDRIRGTQATRGPDLIGALLKRGDSKVAEDLKAAHEEAKRGSAMHELSSRFATHKADIMQRPGAFEAWKKLCKNFERMSVEAIRSDFAKFVLG